VNAQEPSSDVLPTAIQRDGQAGIEISWSDGTQTRWTAAELRKQCPCATCREKRQAEGSEAKSKGGGMGLPVLSAAEARPLEIESMRPVGSYAYGIAFSDGHHSGIFTFPMLRRVDPPTGSDYRPTNTGSSGSSEAM
jgi:DUF971 family protein